MARRGKPLSDDLRGAILNMARYLDVEAIKNYTGCARRTIERILADYRRRGTVMREHVHQTIRGNRRSLTGADVRVCYAPFCRL